MNERRPGRPLGLAAFDGDTSRDDDMLRAAHLRFSVEREPIAGVPETFMHLPDADPRDVADRILPDWCRARSAP